MSADTRQAQTPEPPGVDTRHLLWAAGGTLLLLAGSVAVLSTVYDYDVPVKNMPTPETFPQPRLNPDEREQKDRLLAEQRRRLSGYRWADQQHKLVEIPIGRAMQIIAQQGSYGPLEGDASALSSPTAGAERAVTPTASPAQSPPADGSAATTADRHGPADKTRSAADGNRSDSGPDNDPPSTRGGGQTTAPEK